MLDALGNLLAPYSENIAKVAGTVTVLQFLSGIVLMNDIRKKRSSDAYPPDMFIGGFVLTLLSLKLGSIMNDAAMINVNIMGMGINAVFTGIFYYYASSKCRTKMWYKMGYAAIFSIICLVYASFETAEKVEFRFGMIITSILVALVGLPLLSLGEIMRKKSTEGLPFPMILSGTIVAASWALYGISIKNQTVIYQNIFLLALSSVQLSLFAIYPNTPSSATNEKKDK